MDCPGRTSSLPRWASVPDTGGRTPARPTATTKALAVKRTDRRMRLLLLSWIPMLLCRWDVVTPPSAVSGVAARERHRTRLLSESFSVQVLQLLLSFLRALPAPYFVPVSPCLPLMRREQP